MKVLFTGSREWTNEDIIRSELLSLPSGTVIIHGASPWGADAIVDRIARSMGFTVRTYPATRWSSYLRGHAGQSRNHRMIQEEHRPDEPIDLCIALLKNKIQWGGTMDCLERARAAGIPTRERTDDRKG